MGSDSIHVIDCNASADHDIFRYAVLYGVGGVGGVLYGVVSLVGGLACLYVV